MEPNQTVLYVKDIATSRDFYTRVLGKDAIQPSPTFNFFPLKNGSTLALLQQGTGGVGTATMDGFELVFELPDREAVDRAAATWKEQGVRFVEEPTELPFGYAFIALDPDGTRLRPGYFPQG
jgi:catechol 2,3-dioxygenase-like lactoylglutathione lyase family enzyme